MDAFPFDFPSGAQLSPLSLSFSLPNKHSQTQNFYAVLPSSRRKATQETNNNLSTDQH